MKIILLISILSICAFVNCLEKEGVTYTYFRGNCFEDKGPIRGLNGTKYVTNENCPKFCVNKCRTENPNYNAIGLKNGNECYCGYTTNAYRFPALTCLNYPCPGDRSLNCGGSDAMEIYMILTIATTSASTPSTTKISTSKNIVGIPLAIRKCFPTLGC